MDGVDLSNANLTGTDLRRTTLAGANLSHTDLRGATLDGTNLDEADLTGANVTGVDLKRRVFGRRHQAGRNYRAGTLAQERTSRVNLPPQ